MRVVDFSIAVKLGIHLHLTGVEGGLPVGKGLAPRRLLDQTELSKVALVVVLATRTWIYRRLGLPRYFLIVQVEQIVNCHLVLIIITASFNIRLCQLGYGGLFLISCCHFCF